VYCVQDADCRSVLQAHVGADVIAFAKSIAERWSPDEAYVMDVARSGGSLTVVEFNCLNSSGLFGCDARALVDALEESFG
jgi:hypothetical protein